MSMVDRLLGQLAERGLRIEAGAEPGQLLLCGPKAEKTAEIVRAVKAFKPQLLERFGRSPTPDGPPPADPEGERSPRS